MTNEKRLIKVSDATRVYNGIALYMAENAYLNDTALDVLKMVVSWLNEAPNLDAVEVVHGRWEKAEYNGFLRCDQCKDVYINEEWLEDGKWNYCPSCGAKVDGDGNA